MSLLDDLLTAGLPVVSATQMEGKPTQATFSRTPTDAEYEQYLDIAFPERKWQAIRDERDALIDVQQWVLDRHWREREMIALGIGTTTTLTDDQIIDKMIYIQKLADIPQTFINPDDVVFPDVPE